MNIGDKIKTARLARGMTQQELGDILGVQKSAIAKYESGRVVNIKRSTLKKISDVLGMRPSELIFDEETSRSDALTDIVARLKNDEAYMSLVKSLYKLDSDKLTRVQQFLDAFIK